MAKISTKNIAAAISVSVKNKSGVEQERALKNAVEFLAKKNLLSKSAEILKHLEQISDKEQNILRAKVFSHNSISKHVLEKIENLLKKLHKTQKAKLLWKEDKTLIGGLRIETADEIIDLSLKNKLLQLQNHLLKT